MELYIVLFVGFVVMCVTIAVQMKWYSIAKWKSIFISMALIFTGITGSYIWFFIENFRFGGRSFFGAIFFAPLIFLPLAKILKISYLHSLDFCAPSGCITLAMVKIQCLRDGCCRGRPLFMNTDYVWVEFPSQIVEMIDFLILAVVLMIFSSKVKHQKKIFPYFLVLYGATRFILNFFRDEWGGEKIAIGTIWSIISIIIGIIWLVLYNKKHKKRKKEDEILIP